MAGGTFVGLDIGSTQIKVTELRRSGTGLEITAVGVAPTPVEAYENSVIVDSQLLGQAVKKLMRDSGVTARQVVSSVSGQSAVVVRVIEVPQMNPAELAETMKWEVERHVPFAVNEVIMDYQPIERPEGYADGQNMEVLLAVAQQDMIDRHVEMLFAAGLKPIAIDVEPLAVGRTLLEVSQHAAQPAGHAVAIVNLGASNTDIGIFRDNLPAFFRTLPLAGDSFTRAIADTLQVDMTTAEQYKREAGEVITGQMPTGPSVPDWGTAGPTIGGDSGFIDFSTAQQPAAPTAPNPVLPGSVPSSSPSGRMPFDFSTPGEVPAPSPSGGSGDLAAPAPAAPQATPFDLSGGTGPATDLTGQPLAAPEEPAPAAPDFGPGFVQPEASSAPPLGGSNLPAPTPMTGTGATGDPVLEARRVMVFNAMAPVLTELAQELRRSLDYYRQRALDAEIHEMLLVGGTAKLRNLAQFLETELGIPTRIADPLRSLQVSAKNVSPAQLEDLATMLPVSIGLGARDLVAGAAGAGKKRR